MEINLNFQYSDRGLEFLWKWKMSFIISCRALAREGDYEMMSVCACMRACVCACVCVCVR